MNKKIKSTAYIGGLGNSRKTAEQVAEAIEKRLGPGRPVNPFTFSDWVNDPDEVEAVTRNADVWTHSAGALALSNANFSSAYMLNPPLPRRIGGLALRFGLKTIRTFTPGVGLHSPADLLRTAAFSASSLRELGTHLAANLRPLTLKRISEFDAVRVATGLKRAGKDVEGIAWTDKDMFFSPTEADLDELTVAGVPYKIVPGEHDEVALRPDQFFDSINL